MSFKMNSAARRFLTVVFGSTLLACLLGICIDLVTANVAVEYFSVHHPKILPTENPYALALLWGVGASWWFGAIAGVIVALVNHRRLQPLEPIRILKWTTIACGTIWIAMISILLTIIAVSSLIPMEKRPASFESDRRLVAVAMAHQHEYVLGAIALLVIAVATCRSAVLKEPDMDKISFSNLPDRVKSQLRHSLQLKTKQCAMNALPIGQSRIGGCPDVPPGFVWPRYKGSPLSFIAQLHLDAIPTQEIELSLPQSGSLLFFYDSEQRTWGFDPQDRGSAFVLYTEAPLAKLSRLDPPTDMPQMGLFQSCEIQLETSANLPDAWSIHYQPELSNKEQDLLFKYFDWCRSQSVGPNHRMGGHAECVQNPMEVECQLVSNGLYCGDSAAYEDPRSQALQRNASDWRLLLQIDSDDDASMMWGDAGMIYFWIRESDLRARQFEHTWLILQCG